MPGGVLGAGGGPKPGLSPGSRDIWIQKNEEGRGARNLAAGIWAAGRLVLRVGAQERREGGGALAWRCNSHGGRESAGFCFQAPAGPPRLTLLGARAEGPRAGKVNTYRATRPWGQSLLCQSACPARATLSIIRPAAECCHGRVRS